MFQKFKGVFINPSIFFTGDIPISGSHFQPFWDEIESVLNIVATIKYQYKDSFVNINIHRVSFISIQEDELLKISSIQSILEPNIDKLAFYIFYSFCGMLDEYFITNEYTPNRIPIENFYRDENNKFQMQNASLRFRDAILLEEFYKNPREKSWELAKVLKNGYCTMKIEEFLLTVDKHKKEKSFYGFDEEYYFLISSLDKNRALVYNEGILITGWTICEYLINFLFALDVNSELKEVRREYFKDSNKYPFAFDSKGKLRGYSELIAKADCNAEHKLEILNLEGKFNSSDLHSSLKKLRGRRNIYIHDPSKNSLEIIKEDHFKLSSEILNYISQLKDIIRTEMQKQ
jgi:hypothetical protein